VNNELHPFNDYLHNRLNEPLVEVKLVAVWKFGELAELENASCPCLPWYGLKIGTKNYNTLTELV